MEQLVKSHIRQRLKEGGIVRAYIAGMLATPALVEIIGLHGGFDAIWLDQEHAGITLDAAANAARAARAAGMDSFVRLAATDYATVIRYLEHTAGGILAAAVNTAAQARQIVQWARFAPHGARGIYGANVDSRYGLLPLGEYTRHCGAEVFVGVQIETVEAVENAADIARVGGVDLLFIGPVDLSQSLGVTGEFEHPRCIEAIERVARACADVGQHWGILAPTAAYAKRMVNLGCRMLTIGSDISTIHRGLTATKSMFAEWLNSSDAPTHPDLTSRSKQST